MPEFYYLLDAPVKSIAECGEELLREVEHFRQTAHEKKRPIIFIGHSFGGIIIKKAIVIALSRPNYKSYLPIAAATKGIVFLGTPHDGSPSSYVGQLLVRCGFYMGSSSGIMDSLGHHSDELRDLHSEFGMVYDKEKICFYEAYPTRMFGLPIPLLVVPKDSATFGMHGEILTTDHSGLNKYSDATDTNYLTIVRALRGMIEKDKAAADIEDCLAHLKPADYKAMLTKVREPLENTCNWIEPELDQFLRQGTPSGGLIISGGPGTGKSVLARFVIEYLRKKKVSVSYFLFKDEVQQKTTAQAALATLIVQILRENTDLYPLIREFHLERRAINQDWTLELLWQAFAILISHRSLSTIFVLDALDECEGSSQIKLLEKFSERDNHFASHFITITRPLDQFPMHIYRQIDLNNRDEVCNSVKILINTEVEAYFQSTTFTQSTRDAVRAHLCEHAGTMFVWVVLVIKHLNRFKRSSPVKLLTELRSLPVKLLEIYEELFTRYLQDYGPSIKKMLPWILYARRPLKVSEVEEAFAVQDFKDRGETEEEVWDAEKWKPSDLKGELKERFGALVIITDHTSEIRLIHQSLRGALLDPRDPPTKLAQICKPPNEEHAEIASVCLEYLALPQFGSLKSLDIGPSGFQYQTRTGFRKQGPFLEYAAQNWPYHARQAGSDNPVVLRHFKHLSTCPGENIDLAKQVWSLSRNVRFSLGDSPVMLASSVGLEQLSIALVNDGADINQLTGDKILLDRQIPVNDAGIYGFTPLHHAASQKHPDVVQALLDANADPTIKDAKGHTPLEVLSSRSFFARTGSSHTNESQIVQLLDQAIEKWKETQRATALEGEEKAVKSDGSILENSTDDTHTRGGAGQEG
ncbi:unnamed protein product [Tuber aestivum]|uniref:Uncharacterized protein n=1 Tax=Tuber aestivum TaxID=59557 RepID=A0A292PMV2_9PEZI|nr:unnamed protein product [Tuber aestivum]